MILPTTLLLSTLAILVAAARSRRVEAARAARVAQITWPLAR